MRASEAHGPDRHSDLLSPELVLVDPVLPTESWPLVREPLAAPGPFRLVTEGDEERVRAAVRRITELAEINPPRRRRRSLVGVGIGAVAVLWLEAVVLFLDGGPGLL
jgi:hypothetical protein